MNFKRSILLLSVLISVATLASLSEAVEERTFRLGLEGEFIKIVSDKHPTGKSLLSKEQSELLYTIAIDIKEIAADFLARISSPKFPNDILAEPAERAKSVWTTNALVSKFCGSLRKLKFTKEQLKQTLTRALISASDVISVKPKEFNEIKYKNMIFSKESFIHHANGLIHFSFKEIHSDETINLKSTTINGETLPEIIQEYVKFFTSQDLFVSVYCLGVVLRNLAPQLEACVTQS